MKNQLYTHGPSPETAQMVDLRDVEGLEITISKDGKVWVNADGICVLRAQSIAAVKIDWCDRRRRAEIINMRTAAPRRKS